MSSVATSHHLRPSQPAGHDRRPGSAAHVSLRPWTQPLRRRGVAAGASAGGEASAAVSAVSPGPTTGARRDS